MLLIIKRVFLNKKLFILSIVGFSISFFVFIRFLSNPKNQLNLSDLLKINLFFLVSAVFLHLGGHYLRANNSLRLIQTIKPSTKSFLFKTLSIGYLFNTLLPFRLGELIRAHIIGKTLSISRTVTLFTIVFERLIDTLILIIFTLICLIIGKMIGFKINPILYYALTWLFTIFIIIFTLIILLYKENKVVLNFIHKTTDLFNTELKNRIRFIIWSLIYGINIIFKKIEFTKYMFNAILMWICYITAMMLLTTSLYPNTKIIPNIFTSLSSYLSVTIPSGPAFIGTYHYYFSELVSRILPVNDSLLLSMISWGLLIIPISVLGLYFVVNLSHIKKGGILSLLDFKNKFRNDVDPLNKLLRYQDISSELSHFFDAYFRGVELSHILNKDEIKGRIRILKTFKGGSNAITVLVWNKGKKYVLKSTLSQYAHKLESQYQWIKNRQHLPHIPKIIGIKKDATSYSLMLDYYENAIPFFDYIHFHSVQQSKIIISRIIQFMKKSIYNKSISVISISKLEKYIKIKIYAKVQDSAALNNDLLRVLDFKKISINGVSYDNFASIMKKITKDKRILTELSHHQETTLHGDLTVDNILIDGDNFVLLDSNDENYIADPIVDYAKLYQSLHSGYEFLCKLKHINLDGNTITFEENISSKYTELFNNLHETLKKDLTTKKTKLITFHEAIHYFRMLTYRAKINSETLLAFYAVAIRLLNEFYYDFYKENG